MTDAIGSHRVIRCQSYKASATLTSMAPSPRRQRSTGSRNMPGTLGTPTCCEGVQTNIVRDAVAQARSHIGVGAALPEPGPQGGESCRRAHLDLQGSPLHVLEFDLARALVHQ